MHLAPRDDAHSMGDSDPAATFGYVARELGERGIAFICSLEALGKGRLGLTMRRRRRRLYRQRKDARTCPRQLRLDASLNEPRA
ncbi:hypothetical protein AWV79_37040 [Cupriavidus sp. UYMMa02A]|nr:hypothetical protein AWV79_37040 [Cupriavidus sp. UYMMa02A]